MNLSDDQYKNLNLSKLRACNQYWSEMTPTDQGRVCAQCSKTIQDFRDRSQLEIAHAHANSLESVCGIYSPQQLRSPFKQPPKSTGNWRNVLLISIASLLNIEEGKADKRAFSNNVVLSSSYHTQPIQREPRQNDNTCVAKDSIKITGNIKIDDKEDGTYTSGVGINVVIKGTTIGTVSDIEGNYTLPVPDAMQFTDSVHLVFSFIGYVSKEVSVLLKKENVVDVMLVPSYDTDIIAFYVYERPPLHKRIWAWITRPFRKQNFGR